MSVSEEVKVKYDEIKKKKTHRYLIFFIKDEKTIAIEKIGKAFVIRCELRFDGFS